MLLTRGIGLSLSSSKVRLQTCQPVKIALVFGLSTRLRRRLVEIEA
jgi:hypothetical protein